MRTIWTLITPEGKEVIIGVYATEGAASSAATRKFPSDWLRLCAYPLQQREPQAGEKVERWKKWVA
jgi:hypothetical protein